MTQEEKNTVVDRASNLFYEWLVYLREGGTKFNLPPRQDLDEMTEYWHLTFMDSLNEELDELTRDHPSCSVDNFNG